VFYAKYLASTLVVLFYEKIRHSYSSIKLVTNWVAAAGLFMSVC